MEYLDYYDINGNHLGKETRGTVHADGLWHKTVHCWLYDDLGNVYFQLRAENNKMYTTASGHVNAGETLQQAFGREVKEEIGIDVDINNAELVEIVVWKMDKKKSDGTMWKDRAFANVYINKINETPEFDFDVNEVSGLVKVNAKEVLEILHCESGSVNAEKIHGENEIEKIEVNFESFLINPHEIGLIKYGRILQAIINKTRSN